MTVKTEEIAVFQNKLLLLFIRKTEIFPEHETKNSLVINRRDSTDRERAAFCGSNSNAGKKISFCKIGRKNEGNLLRHVSVSVFILNEKHFH